MPQPSFLNDNEFRDYPFVQNAADGPALPSELVVDFGAVMYAVSRFTAVDRVYLHSLSREGVTLTFDFRHSADVADLITRCRFSRQLTDTEFMTEWIDAEWLSGLPTDSTACDGFPQWEAFLTTGRLDRLADVLGDGETWEFDVTDWMIEPARIQNLAGGYLQTLNLANFPRLIVRPDGVCLDELSSASAAASQDQQIRVQATCLIGNVAFREGFNCTIRQEAATNAIILSASAGGGRGQPCEELALYPDEQSPDGGRLLTGGPSCSEILKSLNGVAGSHLQLLPGSGLQIYAHPEQPNTLVIDRSLQAFAACAVADAQSSESSSSEGG